MQQKLRVTFCSILVAASVSGCATMFKGNKGDIYFKGAPEGMEVIADGQKLDLTRTEDKEAYTFGAAFQDNVGGTSTTFYTYGIELEGLHDRKLTLRLPGGREAQVDLTTGIMWHWVLCDLFFTGPVGLVVDGVTGNWKEFYGPDGTRRTIHVPKVFEAAKASGPAPGPAVSRN
jgi:hypothetical protein